MDSRFIKTLLVLNLLVWLPAAGAKPVRTCPYIPSSTEVDTFTQSLTVPVKRLHLILVRAAYVRANEVHLLKIDLPASKMLDFKEAGTPCKPAQIKCDLLPELTAVSISSLRDEF